MKTPDPNRRPPLHLKSQAHFTFPIVALLGFTAAAAGQTSPTPPPAETASDESIVVLTPFEVSESGDRGYVAGNAVSATRINTGILNLPFSVEAITPQLIADTGAQDLMEMVTQAAGIKSGVSTNTQGDGNFSVRGFVQAPQQNGFSSSPVTSNYVDGSVIERAEVVKGPASLLYGSIAPGGTVNYITKAPMPTASNSLTLAAGSYSYESAILDVNKPILANKLLFRLILADKNLEEYYQNTKGNELVVRPALKWLATPNLSVSVDYQWFHRRATPPVVFLPNSDIATPASIVAALYNPGHPSASPALANKTGPGVAEGVLDASDPGFMSPYPGLPKNFNMSDIHDIQMNDLQTINAEADLKLGAHWSARVHGGMEIDRLYFPETGHTTTYVPPPDSLVYANGAWNVAPKWSSMTAAQQTAAALAFAQRAVNDNNALFVTENGTPGPVLLDRGPRIQEQWVQGATFQSEAAGSYHFQNVSVQPLIGVYYDSVRSYVRTTQNVGNAGSPYFRAWDVAPSSPTYYVNDDEGTFSRQTLTTNNVSTLTYNADEAAYMLVNVTLFQRLFLVGGARYNVSESHVVNRLTNTVSPGLRTNFTTPQVGIGYKITSDTMLYASYSESYTLPTQPFLTTVGNVNGIPTAIPTTPSSPIVGKGYEAGIKGEYFGGGLVTTVSVYQIEEDNVLQSLIQNASGISLTIYNQGAKQRARGLEAEAIWTPWKNCQILANISEEDIRNVAEPYGLEYYLGQHPGFAAKTLGNLWSRYTFNGSHENSGPWIGAGLAYTSKSAGDPRDVAYFVPAYTLYNAAIGYEWKWGKRNMSGTINIKNIGGTYYKPTSNSPGEPRRLLFSLTETF